MPISPAMRRLLRIREIQEEEGRSMLESIIHKLDDLKALRTAAENREAEGRQLMRDSARSGDLSDRLAGLEQERCATHAKALLAERVADAESNAAEQRKIYLAARIQLRQVCALVEKIRQVDSQDEARKRQSDLDEWFRSRP